MLALLEIHEFSCKRRDWISFFIQFFKDLSETEDFSDSKELVAMFKGGITPLLLFFEGFKKKTLDLMKKKAYFNERIYKFETKIRIVLTIKEFLYFFCKM